MWNPQRSAPRIPRRISSRCGSVRYISDVAKGKAAVAGEIFGRVRVKAARARAHVRAYVCLRESSPSAGALCGRAPIDCVG
eukprot:1896975-Pleurochrysis_carterae.AAC.1